MVPCQVTSFYIFVGVKISFLGLPLFSRYSHVCMNMLDEIVAKDDSKDGGPIFKYLNRFR